MTISLYNACVPQFLQILPAMMGVLDKTEAWAKVEGVAEDELLAKSIAPDMWGLGKQVRVAALWATNAVKAYEDGICAAKPTTTVDDLASLRALIQASIDYLEGVDAAWLDSVSDRDVAFTFNGNTLATYEGADYALSFALPNFYFHATTAYGIARSLGVPIGKGDFTGKTRSKQPA